MDYLNPGFIAASGLVSLVGFCLFLYGKRRSSAAQILGGLALMIFPIFVPKIPLMLGIAAGLLGLVWLASRQGW